MTGILVTASVAPLLAAASLRSEQLSQLVLGEGAEVLEIAGDMLRVRTLLDQYEGWLAAGYATVLPIGEVESWLASAAWSAGALLQDRSGLAIRAPHRARMRLCDDAEVLLPNGARAAIVTGLVQSQTDLASAARNFGAAEWAWREFAGTPYLWGGVTGAGIDCSGLVQNTLLVRGVTLPRDAHQQASFGQVVDPADRAPDDLLFFRSRDRDRIGHVGILAEGDMLVHSTVDLGGVVRESLATDARTQQLLARLVAVRRFH
jgi:gamma-D-glutamyl-L-lysine dipeptidyl-peptidase